MEALDLLQIIESPPKRWLSIFKSYAAKSQASLGKIDEAQSLIDDALTTARESHDIEALLYALNGKVRVLLRQSQAEAAATLISEAIKIGKQAEMRLLLAESLTLNSEQQAALGNLETGRDLWAEAQRLYKMVGAPEAKQTPFWLGTNPPPDSAADA